MTIRVVQFATGAVGTQSLRGILARGDLELVGVRVYSPDKRGRDAGALAGVGDVGIEATDDLTSVLDLQPDCAVYTALGDTLDVERALDEVCTLLEAGVNVVSSALAVPTSLDDEVMARLVGACERGAASFHGAGLNPGFLLDVWPLLISRVMRRLDSVRLVEMDDMSDYSSAQVLEFMAFGAAPDSPTMWNPPSGRVEDTTLYKYFVPSARLLQRATGLRVEGYHAETDFAVATRPVEMAAKRIEPGTISGIWSRLTGMCDGAEVLRFDAVYTSGDDVPAAWPAAPGKSRWHLALGGDPSVETTLHLADLRPGDRADMVATASHLVNAIPAVCAASPGLQTALDLPLFAATT